MGKRSKITELPREVKSWLDHALIEGNFAGYQALEADLKARGYAIGKSSIHRYGSDLERRLSAIRASTEAARAIAESAPDDADLRSAATISIIQTDVFQLLVALREVEDTNDPAERLKILSRVGKSMAELSRASVNQKTWETVVRSKVETAATRAAAIAKKGGLSAGAVDTIRREILGIAA